eukprot:3514784-Lingulodinium_polyedra.AAC.1
MCRHCRLRGRPGPRPLRAREAPWQRCPAGRSRSSWLALSVRRSSSLAWASLLRRPRPADGSAWSTRAIQGVR